MKASVARYAAALVFACVISSAASAQTYPNKSIKLIVPFAAGGGTDFIGRLMAKHLSEKLGQQVYVENRGGANGAIGLQAVATAEPDGYTMVAASDTTLVVNPWLYDKLPYDPRRDFIPVGTMVRFPGLLAVHPSTGIKSVPDLLAQAKAKPGGLAYATGGVGNFGHLAGELFSTATGVKMLPVHYKGVGPGTMALLAGDVQVMFNNIQTTIEHVRAGKMVAIAVNSLERSAALPDLPTVAETVPGFEIAPWVGILVPAKTPREIVQRLNKEVLAVMSDPEVVRVLTAQYVLPFPQGQEEFAALIERDLVKWEKVIKGAGIKGE
jgi:tripartite-type tricarboxylate transporter receptor subunit TctC